MRLPIGLHRDPLRNWVVSDEAVARGAEQADVEARALAHWIDSVFVTLFDEEGAQLEMNREFSKQVANWKATQDADYRLRRDYAKVLT